MAVVHSLFRMACTHENNPAHIMQSINETACEGNDANIFVTMFIGILDLPTGRLRYCNAGHDLPLLIGQDITELTSLANLPIGIFNDFHYKTEQTVIPSGTTILLFTDGLTEAKNLMNKQFGLNRVIEAVNGHEQSSTKELLEIITGKVRAFTQGAPQSDDLTMMAIRYTPQMEEDTLNETLLIKNHIKDVEQLNVFVGNITQQLGYEEDEARCIRLAVEEAVVNVISYAYSEEQEGDISIVAQANSKRLQFIITDSGIPFDPTEASQVDITLPAEERRIGGLGIHLVRELMDSINYERENGKNILTLVKKIPKIKK
jgi:sigma-B regulation protein RsbU (phosphoserine phosphatase)